MTEQVENVNAQGGNATEVHTQDNNAPISTPNPAPSPTPKVEPNYAPNVLDTGASDTPPEEVVLEGLFNDTLPEEFQGNIHLQGLFDIARAQFPNLDLNRVLGRAWEMGDPELIDVNYLQEVAGEEYARYYGEYFKDLIDGYQTNKVEELNSWAESVFDSVGGKDNWERVAYVFNNNAPEPVIEAVRGLLDSNDRAQRDAGIEIIKNYARGGGVMPQSGGKSVSGEPSTAMAGALSAAEYQQEVAKLSVAGKLTDEGALEALRQRRMAGMRAGL